MEEIAHQRCHEFNISRQYRTVSSAVGASRLSEAPKVGVCTPDWLLRSLTANPEIDRRHARGIEAEIIATAAGYRRTELVFAYRFDH